MPTLQPIAHPGLHAGLGYPVAMMGRQCIDHLSVFHLVTVRFGRRKAGEITPGYFTAGPTAIANASITGWIRLRLSLSAA